jgi:hypothetical protein
MRQARDLLDPRGPHMAVVKAAAGKRVARAKPPPDLAVTRNAKQPEMVEPPVDALAEDAIRRQPPPSSPGEEDTVGRCEFPRDLSPGWPVANDEDGPGRDAHPVAIGGCAVSGRNIVARAGWADSPTTSGAMRHDTRHIQNVFVLKRERPSSSEIVIEIEAILFAYHLCQREARKSRNRSRARNGVTVMQWGRSAFGAVCVSQVSTSHRRHP